MKRNITINLFGILYNMDEDAYELLKDYMDNMRRFFSKDDEGEEIVADIECRIGELLNEIKQRGEQAIAIEDIKDIMERLGNPEQMVNEEEERKTPPHYDTHKKDHKDPPKWYGEKMQYEKKRWFRDPQDCVLGGVLSGFSHYLGIEDPIVLRIVFLLLFLLSWSSLGVVYLVLWILLPKALSPEERLQMYGKPVTMNNIREEVVNSFEKGKDFVYSTRHQSGFRDFINFLIKIFVFACKVLGIMVLGAIFLGLIVFLVSLIFSFIPCCVSFFDMEQDYLKALHHPYVLSFILVAVLSAFFVLILPLLGLIKSFNSKFSEKRSFFTHRWRLLIVWLVLLIVSISSMILAFSSYSSRYDKLVENKYRISGFYVGERAYDYFSGRHFEIDELENVNLWSLMNEYDDFPFGENYGCSFTIKSKNNSIPYIYHFYKKETLAPGNYLLHAWINTSEKGGSDALYIALGKDIYKKIAKQSFFPFENDGEGKNEKSHSSPIAQWLSLQGYEKNLDSLSKESEASEEIERIRGYITEGWRYLEIPFTLPNRLEVKYGISNEKKLVGQECVGQEVYWRNIAIEKMKQ